MDKIGRMSLSLEKIISPDFSFYLIAQTYLSNVYSHIS